MKNYGGHTAEAVKKPYVLDGQFSEFWGLINLVSHRLTETLSWQL